MRALRTPSFAMPALTVPAPAAPALVVPALIAALVTALVAGTAVAVNAQAQPPGPADGVYYLQSAATGRNAAALDPPASGGSVAQHRPKGDEDHQQWTLRGSDDAYTLENTDTPGRCLGRTGATAGLVDCGGTDARWQVYATGGGRYAVAEPGAARFLTVTAGSDGFADALSVGTDGDLARWFFTPLTPPKNPLPPDDARTLDQVTFLTAHNAYANGVDGGFAPPFIDLFPNQNRGIEQQLAEGVRGFMLDIHQTADGAILCHQSCLLVRRPVALWVDLKRIVDFLAGHRDAVVTVFLEDYVAPEVLRAELARVPALAEVLFHPDTDGVRRDGWPTLAELKRRDKRLLVFTDHSRAEDEAAGLTRDSFGVMYQREWTVENYWSMGPGVGTSDWSCYSRWDTPLTRTEPGFRPLFVMNHFRDTAIVPVVTADNGKVLGRAERFCEPAARKKPNFLAVDRYDLGSDLGSPMTAVDRLNTYWY